MKLGFYPISDSLSIFRKQQDEDAVLFYAPGYLAIVRQNLAGQFERALLRSGGEWRIADEVRRHALFAQQKWRELMSQDFCPTCLTLYPGETCALNCIYCFSAQRISASYKPDFSIEAVRSAARLIAHNCRQSQQQFTVVFHGGGEPALNINLVRDLLEIVENEAKRFSVPIFRYIATGAGITLGAMHWIADHFDMVGLSCDGPPDIQAKQRPWRNGKNSSGDVERMAQIVHQARKPLQVRVTITSSTTQRQPEIADYISRRLRPQTIHVEPVYYGGRTLDNSHLSLKDADEFITYFFEAQEIASSFGIQWKSSGSRLAEIHGTYCHICRNVLHLVPGNAVTACFKTTNSSLAQKDDLLIGRYDCENNQYYLDTDKIYRMQTILVNSLNASCAECFNQFHCARLCPDHCFFKRTEDNRQTRCLINAGLAAQTLQRIAERLKKYALDTGCAGEEIL